MRLIDADAVTRALDDVLAEKEPAPAEILLTNFAKQILSDAPTVDPLTHAFWIREEDEYGYYWSCSHCGKFSYSGKSHYCAHCGAKMDEGKDGKVI